MILKPPPKMGIINRHGMYISIAQAHNHPIMSIDLDMSIDSRTSLLGSHSTPTSVMVNGFPMTPSSSVTWILANLSGSATMSVSSTQSMGMSPYIFLSSMTSPPSILISHGIFSMGMHGYSAHSMPLVSNHFSFGMSNMTLHMSSSILTSNINTSFRSVGMPPPYNNSPFGGGNIP
jgi:hypothetical protein